LRLQAYDITLGVQLMSVQVQQGGQAAVKVATEVSPNASFTQTINHILRTCQAQNQYATAAVIAENGVADAAITPAKITATTPQMVQEFAAVDHKMLLGLYSNSLKTEETTASEVSPNSSEKRKADPSPALEFRKQKKNCREKTRRKELADRFNNLSTLCFGTNSSRMDKSQVLDRAIDLIKQFRPALLALLNESCSSTNIYKDENDPNAVQNEKSFSEMQVYDLLQLAQKHVCFQQMEGETVPASEELSEDIEEAIGLAALSEALVIDSTRNA